ncbi:sensor histidine kinase [Pedobacter hiemivivus]|uniref:ATP-binding protein n=1 Tax=Pedobacter hiemivivus TaxID=2530454 RepID=A0A4R0NA71_9SPHI|nr:ATP-binding protein [Pedobacter hiemivivus]TCC97129.1 ATP-binding protein [Pedobacter hiemivivus]
MAKEHFKVSSGLKTLIGSELITDKNIAVFELVKNSFDAGATEVTIRFEDLKGGNPKIIISDNGKGMTYLDIKDKWLFVAYSGKRDNTEDSNSDYRDKIRISRHYAGAKGVGRFSSDRLGRKLKLITKSQEDKGKTQVLNIDWKLFEVNQSELFQKIPAEHEILIDSNFNFKHGTILEISEVYVDDWNREEIKRLKDKLSKLVRPDLNHSLNDRLFKIYIEVPEEEEEDFNSTKDIADDEEWLRYRVSVNGEVKNFIFDLLNIKTTKIHSKINDKGELITELVDREKSIYKITEANTYLELKNVEVTLYFMGRSAKLNFTNKMGVDVVNYGNIFLYKNGFRIMPYGEPRDDSFGIDARGMQGFKRYLTTRTTIGQVEIHGDAFGFKETTSRDGGLVKTKSFDEIVLFLMDALRRLEKYVVEVAHWGLDDENLKELDSDEYKRKLVELLANVSSDKSVLALEYNKDVLNIVDTHEENSAKKIIRNFKRIGATSKNKALILDADTLEKEWLSLKKDNSAQIRRAEDAIKILEYTTGQNSFLKDSVTADTKELKSLLHHTEKSTYWINKHLNNLTKGIENGVDNAILFDLIASISLENHKIFSFTKYHKSTKFNTFVGEIKKDVVTFLNEYVINVCKFYKEYERLNITVSSPQNLSLVTSFVAVEIPIIVDNLLSNALTAKSRNVDFLWEEVNSKEVILRVIDDGNGIGPNVIDKVFDFHFTTTRNGSGLGLYHIKKIMNDMHGNIIATPRLTKGAEFALTFKRP